MSSREREHLLKQAYTGFNARDVDSVLALMHPDVDWPNAMEGTRVHGHAAVREYWTRQFGMIDSRVEPQGFFEDDKGRVVVEVHQVVRDMNGTITSDGMVLHVYTFEGDLVVRMDVEELPAVSLDPK